MNIDRERVRALLLGNAPRKLRANRMDPILENRCAWAIKLRDGSEAQCGRHKAEGELCRQHAKMAARWSCNYCGGNDELPPNHCADCSRPQRAAR